MYIPFEQVSEDARLWIYQMNRTVATSEIEALLQEITSFFATWTSHGHPLQAAAEIRYQRFLLLAVEERIQPVSNCAIDAFIGFLRSLEPVFQVDFLTRTQLAFKHHAHIFTVPLDQVQTNIQQRVIGPDTQLFDNTITQKSALVHQWCMRVQDTWLRRYLPARADAG